MLEIKNLKKTYKNQDRPAVNNISLSIKDNIIFGLLGLNGAGKSTTFKCITGIHSFEDGEILIDNIDIKKNPIAAKQNLGYIPDNHQTFEDLTGYEYIYFMADMYQVSRKERDERINHFNQMFKMEKALNNQIKTYSHGMKQKIAIMGGIIHYPKLWILDEPLVGLDPISMSEIKNFMKEYKTLNKTIIFSSHIMPIVKELCDEVAIIDQGEMKLLLEMNENIDIEKVFLETVKI